MTAVFLCYGHPDECQNCGGSAGLGGTQERLVTEIGTFCDDDCFEEAVEFQARAKAPTRITGCRSCGLDNFEHTADCAATDRNEP